jgi:Glycosyltransferase Family 4
MIPLIIDLEAEWHAPQSHALQLLKGLYERGHAAELIAVRGSSILHRARKAGIYVHAVRPRMIRWNAALKIRSVLEDGRIELVHVNEPRALAAAWFSRAHRKLPLLCSRYEGELLEKTWIANAAYGSVTRFVASSRGAEKALLDSGVEAPRISVLTEGVDPSADRMVDDTVAVYERVLGGAS